MISGVGNNLWRRGKIISKPNLFLKKNKSWKNQKSENFSDLKNLEPRKDQKF